MSMTPNDVDAVTDLAADETSATTPTAGRGSVIAITAIIILFGNILSRVLGLVREQLAAGYFGTGDAIAAFTVADNLQTLLFDLMVSGALQAALIPVLAQWAKIDRTERGELRHVSGALVTLVVLLVGPLVLLGVWFAPHVVDGLIWFSGDKTARGDETVELTIRLVRIVLPASLLLGIGAVLQAVLYALDRPAAPALSTAVRNVAIVLGMIALSAPLGVESMAWGTLVGAAGVVLLQLWPLRQAGALPRPNLALRHPAVREIIGLYGPVFAGLLVSSLAVIVDRGLAWGAGQDAVGAMRYATTLVQLVLGLIAAAISLAALPTLSKHFSDSNIGSFRYVLGRSLTMVTVLIFPATFGLAVLARPIIDLIFGQGATKPEGVDEIALALVFYLPGTLAAAYDQVLIFAFYSRRNTRVPVTIGVLAVGVYLIVAYALVGWLGMVGLVLANSAQLIFHTIAIWWMARRHFGWTGEPRLQTLIPRCAGAALVMAGVAALIWWGGRELLPTGSNRPERLLRQFVLVIVPMGFAAITYFAIMRQIARAEIDQLTGAFTSRLGRFSRR